MIKIVEVKIKRKHKYIQKCLNCGKEFWTRDKDYCQTCRNNKSKKEGHKHKEDIHVHTVAKKVDLKEEVKGLLFLENRYPEVVDKIRKRKLKADTEKLINNNPITNSRGSNNERK